MKTANDAGLVPDPVRPKPGGSAWSLWLWVGAGFLLLLVGWGVLFTVAREVKVESVPLAPKEARP